MPAENQSNTASYTTSMFNSAPLVCLEHFGNDTLRLFLNKSKESSMSKQQEKVLGKSHLTHPVFRDFVEPGIFNAQNAVQEYGTKAKNIRNEAIVTLNQEADCVK